MSILHENKGLSSFRFLSKQFNNFLVLLFSAVFSCLCEKQAIRYWYSFWTHLKINCYNSVKRWVTSNRKNMNLNSLDELHLPYWECSETNQLLSEGVNGQLKHGKDLQFSLKLKKRTDFFFFSFFPPHSAFCVSILMCQKPKAHLW